MTKKGSSVLPFFFSPTIPLGSVVHDYADGVSSPDCALSRAHFFSLSRPFPISAPFLLTLVVAFIGLTAEIRRVRMRSLRFFSSVFFRVRLIHRVLPSLPVRRYQSRLSLFLPPFVPYTYPPVDFDFTWAIHFWATSRLPLTRHFGPFRALSASSPLQP